MSNRSEKPGVPIMRTAHGKPYYAVGFGFGDDAHESPLPDALDFPGDSGLDEVENQLKARCPGVNVGYGAVRPNHIADIRSIKRKVRRDEFVKTWRLQLVFAETQGFVEVYDPFRRVLRVELSGKDRVRWWSGCFHYPLLIEDSRRRMKESGERLQSLFEQVPTSHRDVIEEAYYEQVMRERLAIFERRKENWRIIRWGSTTALGLVLAAWSLVQTVDRLAGG